MTRLIRPWLWQPQIPVRINQSVWGGDSLTMLPSLKYRALAGSGRISPITAANANGDIFANQSASGNAMAYRPNSTTSVGECFLWNTTDFNVGADASMVALLALTDISLTNYVTYGGVSWGLVMSITNNSVKVGYVDNPTTAGFFATITGRAFAVNQFVAVGIVKRGNTISAFCQGVKASTTGGNGGIRRSAGSGFGSFALIIDVSSQISFGKCALVSVTSNVLDDAAMFKVLGNPWSIFNPRNLYVSSASAAVTPPTLLAASAINIGATFATPRVTFTRP